MAEAVVDDPGSVGLPRPDQRMAPTLEVCSHSTVISGRVSRCCSARRRRRSR